jgi:hypothetical protein
MRVRNANTVLKDPAVRGTTSDGVVDAHFPQLHGCAPRRGSGADRAA